MANGGIIGPVNVASFGKCTVTSKTASTPSIVTTQSGTRLVNAIVVAGGGGGAAQISAIYNSTGGAAGGAGRFGMGAAAAGLGWGGGGGAGDVHRRCTR